MASAGRGFLYNEKVHQLLKGFIVVSANTQDQSVPDHAEFRELLKKIGVTDAKGSLGDVLGSQGAGNVYFILLDPQGEIVHYWGLTSIDELAKGVAKLKAPPPPVEESQAKLTLPDLCASSDPGVPSGLRLFFRARGEAGWNANAMTIVQPVPMKADEWKALSYSDRPREIDAEFFRACVTEIFPGAIRAASSPRAPGFASKLPGTLKLEPAGSDEKFRYALLHGPVQLFYTRSLGNKAEPSEPKFSGTLQAVVKYGLTTPEVHSLRGMIDGNYLYMPGPNGTFKMTAAVESRPE